MPSLCWTLTIIMLIQANAIPIFHDPQEITKSEYTRVRRQRTQSIVDRLERRSQHSLHPLYILENSNVTSLDGISFNNDKITRLSLHGNGSGKMNLNSINGIRRWPKYLHEFGIFNMLDFSISSLDQIPASVRVIRCANVIFDSPSSNASISRINLPRNLRLLSIQHCKASHAAIASLNIAALSHLSELHLSYFDPMRYSDHCCFLYFPCSLQYLCIDYDLMENVLKNQQPQKFNNLKYIWVKDFQCIAKNKRQCKILKEKIRQHFDNHNLCVAGYESVL